MSTPEVDLPAYFARIRYDGPRDVSLATLRGLALAQSLTIPFENFDVLMGRPIALDLPSVQRKLIYDHRGGYCFEQNRYLLWVLQALGFHATPISARVRWKRPRDYTPARTHIFLRIDLDGAVWFMDVGIGNLSLTAPIRFDLDAEQPTPHDTRRIIRHDALYLHQVHLGNEWHDVCEFTLEEMPPIDCDVANWYTSAHPDSKFRNHILAALATPDGGRATLNDHEFTLRPPSGPATKRHLTSRQDLLHTLATHFNLHLPPDSPITLPSATWLQ